jgi:Asp-tRNA(Asn)/Glu-tRNA(Gln) amidotransferase A subunit family amidase
MAVDEALTWETAWSIRQRVADREISPVEVTRHFLERIAEVDDEVHAFLTVATDQALEQAEACEAAVRRGDELGPLHGVPVSLKDELFTKGIRSTAGSAVFRDHVPTEDCVVAERLRAAGAVIIGKTNTPELSMHLHTINELVPEARNPWDLGRTPGGSSGGAAASLAAGLNPLAIGTDGGGSIRQPAAVCGVFGLNPSMGRVPGYGSFRSSPITTSIGPMTRDVRDAAIVLQAIAGPDPRDPTTLRSDPPDYLATLDHGVAGMRFAWAPTFGRSDGADPAVVAAVGQAAGALSHAGATVEEVDLRLGVAIDVILSISGSDGYAAAGHLYEDPGTRALLTPYARLVFERWTTITGVDYSRALAERARAIWQLTTAFETYDAILTPTVGIVAPPLAAVAPPVPGQPTSLPNVTGYTNIVNFTGFCAASVPCGFVDGLPIGLQVIGVPNGEAKVLQIARALEVAAPWSDERPVGLSR